MGTVDGGHNYPQYGQQIVERAGLKFNLNKIYGFRLCFQFDRESRQWDNF